MFSIFDKMFMFFDVLALDLNLVFVYGPIMPLAAIYPEVSTPNMISSTSPDPVYLEDYTVGAISEFGSEIVEQAEVVAFAQRFDPQPFHIDPYAAKQSIFGGLIASGWHTASLAMRMMVDHSISPESSLGSPGVDKIRWLKPVRPGDVLSVRTTVLETKRLRSQPDRGIIRLHVEILNQNREVVMTMEPLGLLRCRQGDE